MRKDKDLGKIGNLWRLLVLDNDGPENVHGDVWGVVTSYRNPYPTRGVALKSEIEILDESTQELSDVGKTIKLNQFTTSPTKCMPVRFVGDVVWVRNARFSTYQNRVSAHVNKFTKIHLYDGFSDSFDSIGDLGERVMLNESHKERLRSLREWSTTRLYRFLLSVPSHRYPFDDGEYKNLHCTVLSMERTSSTEKYVKLEAVDDSGDPIRVTASQRVEPYIRSFVMMPPLPCRALLKDIKMLDYSSASAGPEFELVVIDSGEQKLASTIIFYPDVIARTFDSERILTVPAPLRGTTSPPREEKPWNGQSTNTAQNDYGLDGKTLDQRIPPRTLEQLEATGRNTVRSHSAEIGTVLAEEKQLKTAGTTSHGCSSQGVQVMEIVFPPSTRELSRPVCLKCNEVVMFTGDDANGLKDLNTCFKCGGQKMGWTYLLGVRVRDAMDEVLTVVLCGTDAIKLIGYKPTNLILDDRAHEIARQSTLELFNDDVKVDCLVVALRKKNGYRSFVMTDPQRMIVPGQQNNNGRFSDGAQPAIFSRTGK